MTTPADYVRSFTEPRGGYSAPWYRAEIVPDTERTERGTAWVESSWSGSQLVKVERVYHFVTVRRQYKPRSHWHTAEVCYWTEEPGTCQRCGGHNGHHWDTCTVSA